MPGQSDAEFLSVENAPVSDEQFLGEKHVDMSATRKYFESNLERGGVKAHPYEQHVHDLAAKRNPDPEFAKTAIGILKSESAAEHPLDKSPKGARGPMQIMPKTFRAYRPDGNVDDPNQSMDAAVEHLDVLWKKYKGDKSKIAAAYNAGEPVADSGEPLPPETQAYIPKVLKHSANVKPWANILPPDSGIAPAPTSAAFGSTGAKKPGLPTKDMKWEDAVDAGWGTSVMGLVSRGKKTEPKPGDPTMTGRIAGSAATFAGDAPTMVTGAIAGGLIGSVIPGPGTAVGATIGAAAGSFAMPAAMRRILMDHYEKGDITTWDDFYGRAQGTLLDTLKMGTVGAVTGGAGVVAKGLLAPVGSAVVRGAGTTAAEITAMTTAGAAVQGRVPDAHEFLDAAVMIWGLKGSVAGAAKLRAVYANTGRRPIDILADMPNDPSIKQDLVSSTIDTPRAYVPLFEAPEIAVKGKVPTFEETAAFEKGIAEGKIDPKTGEDISPWQQRRNLYERRQAEAKVEIDRRLAERRAPATATDWENAIRQAQPQAGKGALAYMADLREAMKSKYSTKEGFDEALLKVVKENPDLFQVQAHPWTGRLSEAEKTALVPNGKELLDTVGLREPLHDVTKAKNIPTLEETVPASGTTEATTVYHGTRTDFDTFDASTSKDGLIHLSTDPKEARTFANTAQPQTGAARVVEGTVSLRNPFNADTANPADLEAFYQAKANKTVPQWLSENGYDGATEMNGRHIMVADPAQIKRTDLPKDTGGKTEPGPIDINALHEIANKPEMTEGDILTTATALERLYPKEPALDIEATQVPKGEAPRPPTGGEKPPQDPFGNIRKRIGTGGEKDPGLLNNWDKLYTRLVDDLNPLKVLVDEVQGKDNPLPASKDPYVLARLTRGVAGKAKQFIENAPFSFKDYENTGTKPLKEILGGIDDVQNFEAYLVGKRALELHQRGIESGIDPADANGVVVAGKAKYEKRANDLVKYQNDLAAYLRDSGILSKDAYNAMVEANKSYVPFYRLIEGEGGAAGAGRGMNVRNPIKAIKGSEEKIVSPIESIIKNTYTYLALAERNAVGQAIVNLGEGAATKLSSAARPIDITPEVEKFLNDHGLDPALADGVMAFRKDAMQPAANEIAVFRDGKREIYQVDPEVANAFKATDRQTAGILTKMLAVPASLLRAGVTITPDFMVRNVIRDQSGAFVNSSKAYVPVLDLMKGLGDITTKNETYQNWLKGGGANAAMVSLDRSYINNHIYKLDADTGLLNSAWNVVKTPLEMLKVVSELTENSTRVGEMGAAERVLGTDKNAIQTGAYGSREVTLDFGRMGSQLRSLNQITAFLNASVQGVDRMVRGFKDNPLGFTAKAAASITLPSIGLWLANHEDPRYKELPAWEKDLYWHIFTKDHIYRIPKPFELGLIFGSGPERMLDKFVDENPKAGKGFVSSVAGAFLPSAIPTAAVPVVEQLSNHSFFLDRPLIPGNLESRMPPYQYTPYTTELSKALGQTIGQLPNVMDMNKTLADTKGSIASPIVIDNYIRQWSGSGGQYIWSLADKGLQQTGVLPKAAEGPTKDLADIPFVKAFVVRYPSATAESIQSFEDAYLTKKMVLDTANALKQTDPGAAARLTLLRPDAQIQLRGIQDALATQRKTISLVWQNPALTPDEKRQIIDSAYYAMIQEAKAGNMILDSVDKAFEGYKPPNVEFPATR